MKKYKHMNNYDLLKEDFKGYLRCVSKPFRFLEFLATPLECLLSPFEFIIMLPLFLFLSSSSFTKEMWKCNHMTEDIEQ